MSSSLSLEILTEITHSVLKLSQLLLSVTPISCLIFRPDRVLIREEREGGGERGRGEEEETERDGEGEERGGEEREGRERGKGQHFKDMIQKNVGRNISGRI